MRRALLAVPALCVLFLFSCEILWFLARRIDLQARVASLEVERVTMDSLVMVALVRVSASRPLPGAVVPAVSGDVFIGGKRLMGFRGEGKQVFAGTSEFDVPVGFSVPWSGVLSLLSQKEDWFYLGIEGKVGVQLGGLQLSAPFALKDTLPVLRLPGLLLVGVKILQPAQEGLGLRLDFRINNLMAVPIQLGGQLAVGMGGMGELIRVAVDRHIPAHGWADLPVEVMVPWKALGLNFMEFMDGRHKAGQQQVSVSGEFFLGLPFAVEKIHSLRVPVSRQFGFSLH